MAQSEKCISWLWPHPLHHHSPTLMKSSPPIVRDTTGLPRRRNSRKCLHKRLHFRLGLWTCCHSCDVSLGKAWEPVCFLPQKGILFFLSYTKVMKLFSLLSKDIFLEAVERIYLFLLLPWNFCTKLSIISLKGKGPHGTALAKGGSELLPWAC